MLKVIAEDKKTGTIVYVDDFNGTQPGMVEISISRMVKRPGYTKRQRQREWLVLSRGEIAKIAELFPEEGADGRH